VQFNQAGSYSVIVLNSAGSIESPSAQLTVLAPPLISQNPVSRNVYIKPDAKAANLPDGTNVTFSVVASSVNSALSYQWRMNGANLPGETGPSITITNVQIEDEGDYDCAVTDTADTVFSAPARLAPWISPIIQLLNPPPNNVFGPANYTNFVPAGSTINFGVSILGNPAPFSYIWRSNAFALGIPTTSERTNLFSYTTSPNPVSSIYRIIVTNEAQPFAAGGPWAAAFYITTVADFDQDGISDSFEVANGMSTNNAADALEDWDNDGLSNRAEFQAGTEPTNSLSYLKVELEAQPGAAAVEVSAVANRSYTIQYTDALGTGAWMKLADLFARPTNRVEKISDPAWNTNRFYRVVLPQQP
jgi:hypothetical protein